MLRRLVCLLAAPESATAPCTLSVCLSPGCVADGAPEALEILQAVAPPHMKVEGGPCRSFCGSGPVVVQDTTVGTKVKTVPHKRIGSQDKILQLLYPEGNEPQELLKGYYTAVEAGVAFDSQDYAQAEELYKEALETARVPALELQAKRDEYDDDAETTRDGLEWLIRARRNEALAKMELGNLDSALESAQDACRLSQHTSSESAVVLAQVQQKRSDVAGEMQALEQLFEIPVDEGKLTFAEKNDRRLAKLRLQKLQFQNKKS